MSAAMPAPQPLRRPGITGGWMAEQARAVLEGLDPLARAAALACAVPRWFNRDLLAALMGGMLAPEAAGEMLERMRGWEIVRSMGQERLAYRDAARDALLAGYAQGPALRALHERAHAYFDAQLRPRGDGEAAALDETAWLHLPPEQYNPLREKVYHLLRIDPRGGYELFRALFRGAHRWNLPGEGEALLLTTRGMDLSGLPAEAGREMQFFAAVQAAADYRYDEAEALLNRVLYEPIDPPLRARALAELAIIQTVTGRLDQAVELFSRAWKIWNDLGALREQAAMSNNLGSVLIGQGDYAAARKAFEQALDELSGRRGPAAGSQADLAQAYNNLGTAYEREENWEQALQYYDRSLHIKAQIGDRIGTARTLVNIGSVYHVQIRDEDSPKRARQLAGLAVDLFEQSLTTFRQYGARSEAAVVMYKLALLFYQTDDANRARALLPQTLAEFRALRIPGVERVEFLAQRLGVG